MDLNIKVKSNTKVIGRPFTTNNFKVEILDNAKFYDEKINLRKNVINVFIGTIAK